MRPAAWRAVQSDFRDPLSPLQQAQTAMLRLPGQAQTNKNVPC
jgi:hypothetical protein